MDERCLRFYTRQPASCQLLFHGRAAGVIMAIPFVLCFTLFGIFNLVGGTVLTIMACKPKISKKGLELLQKLMRNSEFKFEHQLDPMQVVGIILLLTGCLLVIIGVSLGVVACRSVNEDKRRRKGIEEVSMSGIGLSTMAERSSRRTSSTTFSLYTPSRSRSRKKSFPSENIASPIVEEDDEDDDSEWTEKDLSNVLQDEPSNDLCVTPYKQNSCIKSRDISFKVTWATDVIHTNSNIVEVVAEMVQNSSTNLRNSPPDSPKTLLTTDL